MSKIDKLVEEIKNLEKQKAEAMKIVRSCEDQINPLKIALLEERYNYQCKKCGSYAVNLNMAGRDDSEPELCDVCYWRTKFESKAIKFPQQLDGQLGRMIDLDYIRKIKAIAEDIDPDWELQIKDIELILLAIEEYSKTEQGENKQ